MELRQIVAWTGQCKQTLVQNRELDQLGDVIKFVACFSFNPGRQLTITVSSPNFKPPQSDRNYPFYQYGHSFYSIYHSCAMTLCISICLQYTHDFLEHFSHATTHQAIQLMCRHAVCMNIIGVISNTHHLMHAPHEHNLIYSGTSDKEPFEKRTQFIMSLSIVAGPKVSEVFHCY